jgi:hypothetical protein
VTSAFYATRQAVAAKLPAFNLDTDLGQAVDAALEGRAYVSATRRRGRSQ